MDVAAASMPAFDDSAWNDVTLPHTWNIPDGEMATMYEGPGWYRRHLSVPMTDAGRRLYLQFDGACKVTDVFVNGTHVGQHRGGNGAFRFDVTSAVNVGSDNVVAVKVDNSIFPDVPPVVVPTNAWPDFTQFGGLYRDVHLLATDPVHVDVLDYASPGVFITPKNVSPASSGLDVRVELVNDDTTAHQVNVEVDLLDATGANVKTLTMPQTLAPTAAGKNTSLTLSATITSPHLWNGRADPYLYTVQVLVKDGGTVRDAVSQQTGFRFYSLDPNQGFLLNDQYLDLHGVNRHQERQGMGWALTSKEHDEDMAMITEMGANAIRLCHYQHSQYFYGLGDKSGVVLWAELGLVSHYTQSGALDQNIVQQLTELVRQSYNHPSIVVWSISNEIDSTALPLLTTLNNLAHTEDPTRPTTLGDNASSWDGRAAISDTVGFNHYADPALGGQWVDGVHQAMPTKTFAISEFGIGASIAIHSATPVSGDDSEEYQAIFHETSLSQFQTRKFPWGKFVWQMFDISSHLRPGGINDKGLVARDHQTRKDAFYFYKANWSTDPFVYITSRRWEPRPAGAADLKVYANTDSVELVLNGTSLGSKTNGSEHVFVWPGAMLVRGANKLDAIGTKGGATYMDSVTWTGM
jgi:beta-galactosidase